MAAASDRSIGRTGMNEVGLGRSPAKDRYGEPPVLAKLLQESGLRPLNADALARFDAYLKLILRWNARTNLTGLQDAGGILSRHFVESIACAELLPVWIGNLLDFGSGAGFPGVPIAICRPGILVTLAESQNKKAAFLREVVSVLGLKARVFSGRAETLQEEFDCVAMRAVDRMERAVVDAASLVRSGGMLALLTTTAEFPSLGQRVEHFRWQDAVPLAGSDQRVIRLGLKKPTIES